MAGYALAAGRATQVDDGAHGLTNMATIGIDATALSVSACGGIGTSQYLTMRALAELELPHRFILYAASPLFVPFTERKVELPWAVRLGSGLSTRSNVVWMQTGVNRLLAADAVDVFWGPRHLLPFRARDIATVATVHDFWHRYRPDLEPWLNRNADRVLVERVVTRADVVVAPSGSTARDAARFCGAASDSLQVVPWGVDPAVFRPVPAEEIGAVAGRLGIEAPYLLCLDIWNPRKNFSRVLEAVAQLPEAIRRRLTLVALGRRQPGAMAAPIRERVTALGVGDRVRMFGDFPQEELTALYSGAAALVYPSFHEGFGMPVLEAMSCGCPVVAADRAALPEVAGDAAILVDPDDPRAIAAAVERVITDAPERAKLCAAGRARAAGFTWRRTAEGMVAAFELALARHGTHVGNRGGF